MTIHLPENLERPILAAVQSGRYASLDDAMAEAASLLVERLTQERCQKQSLFESRPEEPREYQSIWERILARSQTVPDEEWNKLPVDGAEQHDHYIYGTPKRPPSP